MPVQAVQARLLDLDTRQDKNRRAYKILDVVDPSANACS